VRDKLEFIAGVNSKHKSSYSQGPVKAVHVSLALDVTSGGYDEIWGRSVGSYRLPVRFGNWHVENTWPMIPGHAIIHLCTWRRHSSSTFKSD